MTIENIVPYIPVWARSPNKLVRYEHEEFTLASGAKGIETFAVFLDKSKKEQRITAYIKWLNK